MNIRKQKETNRYREQIKGYQYKRGREMGKTEEGY